MAERDVAELEWALKQLRDSDRQDRYARARDYYYGAHPLMFATEKFRSTFGQMLRAVSDNLCPAVVDSVSDRLKVTGVKAPVDPAATPSNDGQDADLEPAEQDDELARKAWDIWTRNRMDVRAPETHDEALLTGDGFALVWPTAGEAVIWSIPASDCAVLYEPNTPGVIRRAARVWADDDDGRLHVDVYTQDRVARWVTKGKRPSGRLSSSTKALDFLPWTAAGSMLSDGVEANPWGRVPLVHFPNRRFHRYGLTELKDVFPLQDALNKTVCDLLVSNEFSAYRQRWATGWAPDEPDSNVSEYGEGRMLYNSRSSQEARFGTFEASDARNFLETIESFRSEVARVSGTPLHYLFITRGDFPSGEAMKSAEARFTRKVEQRQTTFGNQWEDLLALALTMEAGEGARFDGRQLSLEWESAEPTGLHEQPAAGPPRAGRRATDPPLPTDEPAPAA